MNNEIQVTEKMAAFIAWAGSKGEDDLRKLVRDRLMMLKEECALKGGHADNDGFKWDDAMEPNDGNDQWKHGGDCNLCRKVKYCSTQCRPNKLLKHVTTPFLYECYLQENPQELVNEAANGLTPEQLLDQMGVDKDATVGEGYVSQLQ